jgi:hypothetical protein
MGQDIQLESSVIKRFITKDKQERYLNFILNTVKRKKFIDELGHFKHLEFSKFDKIGDAIESVVKQRIGDIKDCYVISENGNIDAKLLRVDYALSETIGYGMGTLIVFGDAKFVYYEGEDKNDRWLSKWLNIRT